MTPEKWNNALPVVSDAHHKYSYNNEVLPVIHPERKIQHASTKLSTRSDAFIALEVRVYLYQHTQQ